MAGDHKGHALYCGRALENLTDRRKVARASATEQLHMRDAAAQVLGIRETDLDHLLRAGLLTPAATARSKALSATWEASLVVKSVVAGVFGLLALVVAVRQWQELRRLRLDGVVRMGTIVRYDSERDPEGELLYRPVVRFASEDVFYEIKGPMAPSWRNRRVGRQVRVGHMPGRPQEGTVLGGQTGVLIGFAALGAGLLCLALATLPRR